MLTDVDNPFSFLLLAVHWMKTVELWATKDSSFTTEHKILISGKEFFFLDEDTKLYKVAPDGWNDQPKKKSSIINFTLFLRIKFFVNHFNVIQ